MFVSKEISLDNKPDVVHLRNVKGYADGIGIWTAANIRNDWNKGSWAMEDQTLLSSKSRIILRCKKPCPMNLIFK